MVRTVAIRYCLWFTAILLIVAVLVEEDFCTTEIATISNFAADRGACCGDTAIAPAYQ